MYDTPRRLDDAGLTRISVKSSRDYYLVRNGRGPAVKVRRCGARLDCECGQRECIHIMSLQLCGFVDPGNDLPMAA